MTSVVEARTLFSARWGCVTNSRHVGSMAAASGAQASADILFESVRKKVTKRTLLALGLRLPAAK